MQQQKLKIESAPLTAAYCCKWGSRRRAQNASHILLLEMILLLYNCKFFTGSGVTTYSLHPGIVDTEINRSFGWMKYISVPLFWPVTKTAVQGAQTTIYLALDPDVEKESGKYYRFVKILIGHSYIYSIINLNIQYV